MIKPVRLDGNSKLMKELIKDILDELFSVFDFDVEKLMECDPIVIESILFDIIANKFDENDIPSIEWVRFVEFYEAEELKNEEGEFVSN
jgi:hypothetical protein